MLFRELPVGASYSFGGLQYTKTDSGGGCIDATGTDDWCAGDNIVELAGTSSAPLATPVTDAEVASAQDAAETALDRVESKKKRS